MEKNKKKQEYYSYAPWEDNYESTADTDSGQDAFEDYLADFFEAHLIYFYYLS